MKIICVCGLNMGSSLILKMNVAEVLYNVGLKADVEHSEVSSLKSEASDYILTTAELAKTMDGVKGKIIICNNLINRNEIRKSLVQGGVIAEYTSNATNGYTMNG